MSVSLFSTYHTAFFRQTVLNLSIPEWLARGAFTSGKELGLYFNFLEVEIF